jgi:O-antigen ligase
MIVAGILLLVMFIPNPLLVRFADISSGVEMPIDTRLRLWRDALPLLHQFRFFGSAPGSFESVFLRFQSTNTGFRVQFAHNDYLQALIELGPIGALLLAIPLTTIIAGNLKVLAAHRNHDRRLIAVACAASFLALAIHSLVDFNVHIPANAMTLAWIAGVTSGNSQTTYV